MLYQSERHQPKVLRHSRQHPSQLVHGGILVAVGTSDFNISKTQHNLIKMWIGVVVFLSLSCVCVFYTPEATVALQSAVLGHRHDTPQSAWWSPACPHCWRSCWSTACLQRSNRGGRKWVEVYGERTEGYGKKDGVRGWRDGEQTL